MRRVSKSDVLEKVYTNDNSGSKDFYVKFLDKDSPLGKTVIRRLRMLGYAIEFWEHTEWSSGDSNKKLEFTDKKNNGHWRRICAKEAPKDKTPCYWCENGYKARRVFVQRCLERIVDEDGKVIGSVHKLLEKGKGIFDELAQFESDNEEFNKENAKGIKSGEEKALCEFLGGVDAPDVKIKAEKVTPKEALGGTKYTVSFYPQSKKLTEEEQEIVYAVKRLTAEEKDKLYAEDPGCKDMPEWMYSGHQIEVRYKYTAPKLDEEATESSSLSLSALAAEDDDDVPPPSQRPKATTGKKATAPVVEADEDAPEDDEPTSLVNPLDEDDDDSKLTW